MREELNCRGNSLILNLRIQDSKMTITYRVYQGEQQKASLKLRRDKEAGDEELGFSRGENEQWKPWVCVGLKRRKYNSKKKCKLNLK